MYKMNLITSKLSCSYFLYQGICRCIVRARFYNTGNFDFPERKIKIQTCGELYKTWKREKKFRKLPESNLTFNVSYIDTRPNFSAKSEENVTVLALHGAPGSWKDYTSLSSFLHERGCRVIAPSFPDYHVCKPGIFRHSHLEKAQYIKDFLAAISVSCIDLLICHSGSVYPGLNLCLSDEPKIKSLALLNPGVFNLKEMRATKHFNVLKGGVKAIENPIFLKFMEICGAFILKNILKVPVRVENIFDPLLSAATMVHANVLESKEKFFLVSKKLPVLLIFSEDDSLISKKPSYELAEHLGANPSDIFTYNSQGILVQKGIATPSLKVLAFQEGSHYAFLKYPEIINNEIIKFLHSITKNAIFL